MKFTTVATIAALFAAVQCAPAPAPVAAPAAAAAPAPWFWDKEWDYTMCSKATHKTYPENPMLNDYCRENCKNCVRLKVECKKKLTQICEI
ncbi:hypothetical protein TWF718_005641 [Orbilia javanica]|uniref:ShKT domain-containing protein n=1 Tax=Orbilia javanica TaxID=47235 RepID=A0AAN8RP22_9PEZI